MMPDVAKYSAVERLRDGRPITIRAQRSEDQADLAAAVEHVSARSFYLRFFGAKRDFSDREIAYFMNADFIKHVALVAVLTEEPRPVIVAGARYVVVRPGVAEVAFAVIDEYQGQGLGPLLLRHLVSIARPAGITELVAEVLAANRAMLRVFESSGLQLTTSRESEVVHVTLRIA